MRKTILLGTIAVLSIAIAACNQSSTTSSAPAGQTKVAAQEPAPGSKNETVSAAKDAVAGAVGTVNAVLTTSTPSFVQAVAMGDMYEIEASKIAVTRARSADVKTFAQGMIDAHAGTTKALKAALMHAGMNIPMPTDFDARHKGLLDDLKGAKAEDFDGRFIAQQENAHNEALILMRGYAKSGDNIDVKGFAETTLPKVQMHLDMIKNIDEAHKAAGRRADNSK